MKKVFLFLAFAVFVAACGDDSIALEETDLISYGAPITINAPADSDIKGGEIGDMKEVTIIKEGTPYNVQLIVRSATSTDAAKSLASEKANVELDDFTKYIKEDANGFTFQTGQDSTANYDFRYIHVQGDKEYLFQTARIGVYFFTESEINMMYNAVKQ